MVTTVIKSLWLAMLAAPLIVTAQTWTSCNPLHSSCPSNPGLTERTFSTDFTKGQKASWSVADYTTVNYSKDGAAFTVKSKTDAPTLSTDFYMLFGYIEVRARAAPGTGIVSSIVLQSDDLDEIDWEWLGGVPTAVQTNFFGKGNTTTYNRMVSVPVTAATTEFHTYALNWTSTSLTWLIDGVPVRTLLASDASALNGKNYPQTPCQLKLGNWAAGASEQKGTVEWAGGVTDFSQGPFTMMVQSVKIVNYNPAKKYTYSDRSGDWTSIKIEGGSSSSPSPLGQSPSVVVPGSVSGSTGLNSVSASSSSSAFTASTLNSTSTSTFTTLSPSTSSSTSTATAAASTSSSRTSTASASYATSINGAVRRTESGIASKIAYVGLFALGAFWL